MNPTLRGSATTPAGYVDASPSSIAGAVQGLLDSVCEDQLLTEPVFLVARAWLPHFIKSGLVKWSDELGAYLLLGTHRIAFDCIANEGPAGTTTNADGSEVWIYMMLPVQAAVADESDGDVVAVRAALRNVYTVRAERQFGYWFDPERVRAAKASIDGCAS